MSGPRLAYRQVLACSFCGKRADEVRKLIAGPTVFICDECVALCQDIIAEGTGAAPAPVFTEAQEERVASLVDEALTRSLGPVRAAEVSRFVEQPAHTSALLQHRVADEVEAQDGTVSAQAVAANGDADA